MGQERRIRILRLLEYVGPESWVRDTIARSSVKGVYHLANDRWISEAVLGDVSEIITAFPETLPIELEPEIPFHEFERIHAPIELIEAN